MTTIQIRIDTQTKKSAKKILHELGIDMSAAIKIYLKQIILRQGIPFQLLTENGLTPQEEMEIIIASKEAKKGIDIIGPFKGKEAIEYLNALQCKSSIKKSSRKNSKSSRPKSKKK